MRWIECRLAPFTFQPSILFQTGISLYLTDYFYLYIVVLYFHFVVFVNMTVILSIWKSEL